MEPNALKMRYVQEADVLLREGYEKVRLFPLIQAFRSHLNRSVNVVQEHHISSSYTGRPKTLSPKKIRP
jgi:hypothetical protein